MDPAVKTQDDGNSESIYLHLSSCGLTAGSIDKHVFEPVRALRRAPLPAAALDNLPPSYSHHQDQESQAAT